MMLSFFFLFDNTIFFPSRVDFFTLTGIKTNTALQMVKEDLVERRRMYYFLLQKGDCKSVDVIASWMREKLEKTGWRQKLASDFFFFLSNVELRIGLTKLHNSIHRVAQCKTELKIFYWIFSLYSPVSYKDTYEENWTDKRLNVKKKFKMTIASWACSIFFRLRKKWFMTAFNNAVNFFFCKKYKTTSSASDGRTATRGWDILVSRVAWSRKTNELKIRGLIGSP